MVITELVTEFGFKGQVDKLTTYNEGLSGALSNIAKMTAALAVVTGAVDAFVVATLGGKDAQAQLSKNTNIGIEAIQELGYAASVSGSSVQAMEGTLDALSQKIGDAAQKGSEDFARLGISVRDSSGKVKTADKIFGEVGQRFKQLNLSLQEQKSFASALGIDASLVQLLNKTSSEMASLRQRARDLGVITDAQADEIIAFNDSLTTLKFGLNAVKDQIAIGLSPAIKAMAEKFTDFLATNKDLISQGLSKAVLWIGYFSDFLGRVWPLLLAVGAALLYLKVATIGFGVVLNTVLSPVVLWTAAIAALIFIVDDLIVAFQGGESVIADFFQEMFGWDIGAAMRQYVKDFSAGIEGIQMLFDDLFSFIDSGFERAANAVNAVKGFFGFGNGSSNVNNSVSQSVSIEIKTNDPEAAGRAVSDGLREQLANADVQLNRGGL